MILTTNNKISLTVENGVVRPRDTAEPLDFTDMHLEGLDFSNLNLHLVSFAKSTILGCTFQVATNCDFSRCVLRSCNFSGGYLVGSKFNTTKLAHSDLRGTNLSYVNLKGAELLNVSLWGATFAGAGIEEASFKDCDPSVYRFDGIAEWGPLYIMHGKMIKCGCRWFTLEEALAHWDGVLERRRTLELVKVAKEVGWITSSSPTTPE